MPGRSPDNPNRRGLGADGRSRSLPLQGSTAGHTSTDAHTKERSRFGPAECRSMAYVSSADQYLEQHVLDVVDLTPDLDEQSTTRPFVTSAPCFCCTQMRMARDACQD